MLEDIEWREMWTVCILSDTISRSWVGLFIYMLLTLYGNSEISAHLMRILDYLTWLRHLTRSRTVTNRIFFLRKDVFLFVHNLLSSNISTTWMYPYFPAYWHYRDAVLIWSKQMLWRNHKRTETAKHEYITSAPLMNPHLIEQPCWINWSLIADSVHLNLK